MKISAALAVLCWAHLAYGGIHTLKYFYTGSTGIPNFPDFVAVGMVDDIQIDYYDSVSQKEVVRDWMKKAVEEDPQYIQRNTDISKATQEVFRAGVGIIKQRFNQTGGVHVAQRHFGCEWDDVTGATKGFDQHGYDGEDFISLDLGNMRYIAPVKQALPTKHKWDIDRGWLENEKQYLNQICVEWLQKYVRYGSSTLGRKVPPEVSLLQKDPSSSKVACHATGFYPEGVMIIWKRDGQEMQEDVDVGETLPNEDGTFQKRAVLTVSPEDRKKGQYTCEVAHQSTQEPIVKTLENGNSLGIIIGCVVGALVLIGAVVAAVMIRKNKDYKKAGQSDTDSDTSNPIARKGAGFDSNEATGATKGFDQYGYDGEDVFSLDLDNMRYIAPVPQAVPTKQKWDSDKAGLENEKYYFTQLCIEWLQKYVQYDSSTLGRKGTTTQHR